MKMIALLPNITLSTTVSPSPSWLEKSSPVTGENRLPRWLSGNLPANTGDLGSVPGSGRSPGKGNGNSLQYSCLKNPTDRGAWQAMVHGMTRVGHYLAVSFFFNVIFCLFNSFSFLCTLLYTLVLLKSLSWFFKWNFPHKYIRNSITFIFWIVFSWTFLSFCYNLFWLLTWPPVKCLPWNFLSPRDPLWHSSVWDLISSWILCLPLVGLFHYFEGERPSEIPEKIPELKFQIL